GPDPDTIKNCKKLKNGSKGPNCPKLCPSCRSSTTAAPTTPARTSWGCGSAPRGYFSVIFWCDFWLFLG
uniref:Uncharacterized protein n=1 Tax=Catharus ustulatus TaxID=91951 RepID=A0A8C3UUI6_CATUS